MKILVTTLFALTAAGLGFYIFDLRSDLATARAHAEIVQESERTALAKIQPLQKDLERLTAERSQTEPDTSIAALTAEPGAPAAKKEDQGLLGGLGKLMAMPEMKSSMRRQAFTENRKKFADLLKSWALSKSDEQTFLEMVTDIESVGLEAVLGMLGGSGGDPDAAIEKAEAAEEETKSRIKSLLGDTRYSEWEKAQEQQGAKEAAASFKEHIATAGLKLPEAQETQLLQLVADERKAAGLDSGTGLDSPDISSLNELSEEAIAAELKKTEVYQSRVLEKAVKFLNPDQVNALQSAFGEENSELKMGIEVVKTFLPAAKPPGAPKNK